jgi:hypothetical protein
LDASIKRIDYLHRKYIAYNLAMSDTIVEITERARAVLALSDALEATNRQVEEEKARHVQTMAILTERHAALRSSIFKLGVLK